MVTIQNSKNKKMMEKDLKNHLTMYQKKSTNILQQNFLFLGYKYNCKTIK